MYHEIRLLVELLLGDFSELFLLLSPCLALGAERQKVSRCSPFCYFFGCQLFFFLLTGYFYFGRLLRIVWVPGGIQGATRSVEQTGFREGEFTFFERSG